MISPAKRHYQRVMAEKEAAASADDKNPHGDTHNLMQAKLFEDTRRLKAVESIKSKVALKAELLPDYGPYIEGVLTADSGVQDDVLMTVMLWCIDAGEAEESFYQDALQIAEYAIRHNLPMPDKYQRSTACVIAEEVSEAAIKGLGMAADILLRTESLTEDQDMPDQVRAKLHKALGIALTETKPECALRHFKEAVKYHDKCGVKKFITDLEKQLKNAASTKGDSA